jgi:hypothetical protein
VPFIAPFIPAIIKGGIALGTGLAASKLSSGGQPKLNPYETGALGTLQGLSGQLGQYGPQFLSRAQQAFGPAQDYWSRILRGDRSSVMGALAPEIESLTGQTQAVRQMQGELQPRGGPGAAYLSQLPYDVAGKIGGMISQARSGAAAGLAQLGGAQGQLGLGALGQQQGAAGGILDAVLKQKDQDLYRRQMEFNIARQIGQSIYGLLGGMPGKGGAGEVPAAPATDPYIWASGGIPGWTPPTR